MLGVLRLWEGRARGGGWPKGMTDSRLERLGGAQCWHVHTQPHDCPLPLHPDLHARPAVLARHVYLVATKAVPLKRDAK